MYDSHTAWRGRTSTLMFLNTLMAIHGSFLFAAEPESTQLPPDFEATWHKLVAEHRNVLDTEGVVGASLAFVHDGKTIAVDYYGMEDLSSGRPVDAQTIFHWASITKTFTAVAIMQLRDRGLVRLSDPVVRHVPELREVHNPFGSMEEITIRQLLSHTAGFRGRTWPWGGDEAWHPYEPAEWSQLVAMIPYTKVLFEAGSRYEYSNLGYVFLGRIMEKVTGENYQAYIDKNIFDPLGMRTGFFNATPWHLLDARSNNYHVIDGQPVANGLDFNTGITVANGGLNATVGDMARWLGFLMSAPAEERTSHDNILSRSSLEEMWKPIVTVSDPGVPSLEFEKVGLSFFLYGYDGGMLIGHTGRQMSFSSFVLLDPEADVGIIGVYNTAGGDETAPDTREIGNTVQVRVAREIFPLFPGDAENIHP